jgi:uncharacterized membrane protein YeaQ/YmgE (transglycosylase-associated protein family)
MSLLGFIILLIIAAIAGSAGMALAGWSRGGLLLVAIVIGFVGAYIGVWLAGQLGLPTFLLLNIDGRPFPVIWAIIGAALLSAILGLLFRPRRYYR